MNDIFNINIHESFMARAIELAKQGRGNVSPNPLVGCVLVKDGNIIAEGFHEKFGGPHAEVMAIRNAIEDPLDSIAYINLEPCSITGKTPPCSSALIENGISEVYIGMLDPNPLVNGKGIEQLEKAGIIVHKRILEEECNNLNKAFKKWITLGIPWVILKVAQSKDGYMGIDSDTSIWITGKESKTHSHKLRSEVDAVMIGRQTALIDDPSLTVREVRGNNPLRIVLDTNRTLPLNLKIFNDKKAETISLCSKKRFKESKTHFCQYLPVKELDNQLSPLHILKALGDIGITSILIEGGQKVLQSFIDTETIDQIFIYTNSKSLENAYLKNPITIPSDWLILKEEVLGEDNLLIAEKRGEECLQEL